MIRMSMDRAPGESGDELAGSGGPGAFDGVEYPVVVQGGAEVRVGWAALGDRGTDLAVERSDVGGRPGRHVEDGAVALRYGELRGGAVRGAQPDRPVCPA